DGRAKSWSSRGLHVATLGLPGIFVFLAGRPYARIVGNLGDRDLPPAFVARHARVAIDLDVDHDRALDLARVDERGADLVDRARRTDDHAGVARGIVDGADDRGLMRKRRGIRTGASGTVRRAFAADHAVDLCLPRCLLVTRAAGPGRIGTEALERIAQRDQRL